MEEVDKPEITGNEVSSESEAAGMCRTDFQLIDGYFKDALNLAFTADPTHSPCKTVADSEIRGSRHAIANLSPPIRSDLVPWIRGKRQIESVLEIAVD